MKEQGYTVIYFPWDDITGRPRVAGRFKTEKEKDDFLDMIQLPDSGWMDEELMTISVIDDYNYMLPR